MIEIVSWTVGNNFAYLWGYSNWSMIVIVSLAVENNFVYLRAILIGL